MYFLFRCNKFYFQSAGLAVGAAGAAATVAGIPIAIALTAASAFSALLANIIGPDKTEADIINDRLDKWAVKIAKCFEEVNRANLEFAKRVTTELGDIRNEIKRLDGRMDKMEIAAIMREYDQHIIRTFHVNTAYQLMLQTPFSHKAEYRMNRNKFESYCGKDKEPVLDQVLGYLWRKIVHTKDSETNLLEVFLEHFKYDSRSWFKMFIEFQRDTIQAYNLSVECDAFRNASMLGSGWKQIAYIRSNQGCYTASNIFWY